jgi:hypothetical protein cdiviTM7_00855
MIGATSTAEVSPTGIDGDGFDVFSSLRDGAGGEDFSSGVDDIGEEVNADTDETTNLDLVAVASGEEELPSTEEVSASIGQTACVTCVGCPYLSQCVKPQALAMKQESEKQENIAADMSSAGEEAVPNLMEMTPKQSYLERLLAPDDFDSLDENGRGELVMAGYSEPINYQESITKKAPKPVVAEAKPIDLTTKTNEPTEKIIPQEREDETSTNQAVEASGEDVDTEATETPFFELKTAPEIAADDTTDVGKVLSESASEVLSDTSGEEYFTEPTEENRPSIEIKQQTSAIISDAVDKENQQPAFESSDIPTQTQTKTVPSSPAVSKDTQTANENNTLPKNETANFLSGEGKPVDSVVENTYDGDETTAPSSVKTPSIERQKEKVFVITGSESANSEPSRAAENDESATPVSEQQQLAAQFDAVKADEPAATDLIDNSGTKASTDAQPSEISIDAAPDYNNFVESTDGVDVEQPKHVIPTASNVSPYQEQEDAVNVSAEYETNETSTEKIVNAAESIPAKEQPDQPVIVSLSAQDIVEYGEDNEAWAEEDMVFFVEQQAPSSVELNVSSAEMVTIALSMEATTVREEVDDLKPSVDDEISVDMDSAGQLDNSKAVSVPEVTNDYEPVEQIVIPTSPAIELIPDVELDEPVVEILEERIMPREERDNIVMKASEKSDLLRLDAEVETITMDTSGIESVVDLSEAQAELAATEVSEAVESEVDEQNDLAVASYGYNSEMSAVSDNVLVVKSRPSPGLWPDDSQLNPEEEFTTTTQSSADDSSLVSRLVGMFVVAMCVVRGRQSVKV